MATTRFDQLATDVAYSHTRRSALRLLGLALLGGSLGLGADPMSAKDRGNTHGHRADRPKPAGRKTDGKPRQARRKRVNGEDSSRTPRVSGGTAVPQGKYPFAAHVQASVVDENSSQPGDGYTYSCSGSLIDRSHILTAAHCVFNQNTGRRFALDALTVRVGQIDRTVESCTQCRKRVSNVVVNEAYDIAVLTLDSPVAPSVARPIPLIFTNQHSLDATGKVATIAGWGNTTNDEMGGTDVLREAQLTVQSDAFCEKATGSFPEIMLCTAVEKGHDGCHGDSGGPLFVKHDGFAGGYVQIGVVVLKGPGCPGANGAYGTAYARLSHFIINDFIRDAAPEAGGSTACATCRVGDTCCPPTREFPRGFCAPRGVACPPVGASPEPPPPACAKCKPGQRCCPRSPQFPEGFCASAAVACPPAGAVRATDQDSKNTAGEHDTKTRKRAKDHKGSAGRSKQGKAGRRD